jgi:hypothetical protein
MSKQTRKMIMTIERTGDGPTGDITVTDFRPMGRIEALYDWVKHRRRKRDINHADLRDLNFEPGSPVSVGIELSPEIYAKLINGNSQAVQAANLLREQPISMSLIPSAGRHQPPSMAEIQETVV